VSIGLELQEINGVLHKKCRGKLHPEGEFLPVTSFYAYKDRTKGRWRSICIDCEFARKGAERNVPVDRVWINWIDEIVYRVGIREGMRQLGMSDSWYRWFKRTKPRSIHRSTARKIITTLKYLRANEIARHRKSIRHGAHLRGRQERTPQHAKDFNGPNMHATERRRNWSQANPERQRANDLRGKARKQQKRAARNGAITG
jgi:hypothetical protein